MEKSPFVTDGCSGGMSKFWRFVFRSPPPWEGLCVEHDFAYWSGGTAEDRKKADIILRQGVIDHGRPIIAWAMYFAVRLGGAPWWPLPWRWNYGYRWPSHLGYDERKEPATTSA